MKEVLIFFDGHTAPIPPDAKYGKKEIYKAQASIFPKGSLLLYPKSRKLTIEYADGKASQLVITELLGQNPKGFVYARPIYKNSGGDLIALRIVGEAPWQHW